MGSVIVVGELDEPAVLSVRVVAPGPLAGIDLVRSGRAIETIACNNRLDCELSEEIADLEPGGYLYLRARQVDGGAAWSSPFFFD